MSLVIGSHIFQLNVTIGMLSGQLKVSEIAFAPSNFSFSISERCNPCDYRILTGIAPHKSNPAIHDTAVTCSQVLLIIIIKC